MSSGAGAAARWHQIPKSGSTYPFILPDLPPLSSLGLGVLLLLWDSLQVASFLFSARGASQVSPVRKRWERKQAGRQAPEVRHICVARPAASPRSEPAARRPEGSGLGSPPSAPLAIPPSIRQLDRRQLFQHRNVPGPFHGDAHASPLRVLRRFLKNFHHALRKLAFPRCFHRLVAQNERHAKTPLARCEPHNRPLLALQPQRPPRLPRVGTPLLHIHSVFLRQLGDEAVPHHLGRSQRRGQFLLRRLFRLTNERIRFHSVTSAPLPGPFR